jgi:hypothetical protein
MFKRVRGGSHASCQVLWLEWSSVAHPQGWELVMLMLVLKKSHPGGWGTLASYLQVVQGAEPPEKMYEIKYTTSEISTV